MAANAVKIPFTEASAPSTPAANKVVIYAKSDGLMYSKDDAGTETLMSAGGGGIPATILAAKGDVLGASANDTPAVTSVGANDTVLTAASGQTSGLIFQVPLPSKAYQAATADTTTATDTIIDVTGASFSLAAGNWLVWGQVAIDTGSAVYTLAVIADSSNVQYSMGRSIRNTGTPTHIAIPPVLVSGGTTYKLRVQTGAAGTALRYAASTVPGTTIAAIRVA